MMTVVRIWESKRAYPARGLNKQHDGNLVQQADAWASFGRPGE
jgi:hypothetical protein